MTRMTPATLAALLGALAITTPALAGPFEKATNAVDPDCSVGKAARGAATKAVVGSGAIAAVSPRPCGTRLASTTGTRGRTTTMAS